MLIRADKNKFVKMFDPETGFYARTSVLEVPDFKHQDEAQEISNHDAKVVINFLETTSGNGHDPFMADYPEL